MEITREQLCKMIDHTNLKPHATEAKIKSLCAEAADYGFIAVCVNELHVPLAVKELQGTDVLVAAVVGFPLGASSSKIKAYETRSAVDAGAAEIDMVVDQGSLRSGDGGRVEDDIRTVVEAAAPAHVKVILETCYLTDEQIVEGCKRSVAAGAHFVKTSTGFGAFGAFEDHVRLMRQTVGPNIGVKASGGMNSFKDAWHMIKAGANRLGVSAGIPIVQGLDLLKYSKAWLEDEIPCHLCPSRAAVRGKVPKELYLYFKERCRTCEHREYNRYYE